MLGSMCVRVDVCYMYDVCYRCGVWGRCVLRVTCIKPIDKGDVWEGVTCVGGGVGVRTVGVIALVIGGAMTPGIVPSVLSIPINTPTYLEENKIGLPHSQFLKVSKLIRLSENIF